MQINQLIQDNWGIAGEVTELPGERDLNFKVSTHRGDFIFKVHQATESQFIKL